jgi:hypothetical protein
MDNLSDYGSERVALTGAGKGRVVAVHIHPSLSLLPFISIIQSHLGTFQVAEKQSGLNPFFNRV